MKYSVDIDVHGTVHLDVEAKDAKEAYRRIEEKMRLKTIYSQASSSMTSVWTRS